MMHAGRIKVNNEPQKILYHRQIQLPDRRLSIKDISKHLKEDETFDFQAVGGGHFLNLIIMNVYGFRNETKQEVKTRVAREVAYNENYEKHHLKFPPKK